jgi:hypothetical protein
MAEPPSEARKLSELPAHRLLIVTAVGFTSVAVSDFVQHAYSAVRRLRRNEAQELK